MTQISSPSFFFRPQLMEVIHQAMERPLLCVVAPIGYGKTLTVREALPSSVAWQTLVSDSPAIFWEKAGAFFRPYCPALSDRIEEMGVASSEPDLDGLLSCFDSFSSDEPLYFVLDDCHVLPDRFCWRFVELLARRRVENLHMVLLSRSRLPIAIEDLQLKGLAQEIGMRELSFSPDDILGLFAQCGLSISVPNSQELFEATSGWVSAVCLYALGYITYILHKKEQLEKGNFSDFFRSYENEQMHRLLEETVYRTCSKDEKKLLMAMCHFDGFTIDTVDFIMERVPGITESPRQVLGNLLTYNGFIRKRTLENRYEIHPVLVSFLRRRMDLQPKGVRESIYKLLGDWYVHTDSPMSAAHFYLEGQQYERLLELFVTRQEIFNDYSNKDLLVRCFSECPTSLKRSHMLACLLCAKFLLLYGEPSLFKHALFEVQSMTTAMAPGTEKDWVLGELELLMSFTCFGEPDVMYDHLMRAAFLLSGKPSRVVGKDFPFGFGANALITLFYRKAGTLDEVNEKFAELMPVYMTLVPDGGDGAALLLSAECAYCRGEWNESYRLVHEAMDRAMESSQVSVLLMGYHLLLLLALVHGDYREYGMVQKELRRAIQSAERDEVRHSAQITLASAMLLTGNDTKSVPEWILQGRFYSKDLLPQVYICAYVCYAQLLMNQESYSLFLSFYRDMENINRRYPSTILMIFANIYRAAALDALGQREAAEAAAEMALSLAEADRIYMPFVQNLHFLKGLAAFMERKSPDFMGHVQGLRKDFETGVEALSPSLSLARLFTDRENQILSLLQRSYTNKQIATELFIAEITVKKNLARIAEKLGVRGRMNILRALSEQERHPNKS